jgi:hypothetical protein
MIFPMKTKLILLTFFLPICLFAFSQNSRTPLLITSTEASSASYTDMEITINGKTDLHITASFSPLNNSSINLNSENSWIFFDNIKPSSIIDSVLQYIYVNNNPAVLKTNVRVSIYNHGTVIIPQPSTFQPLEVFTNQNFTGNAQKYSLFTINTLGAFDNNIRAFKLKRGYLATLANNADGTGYSRVFIADKEDISMPVMPAFLDSTISFIKVMEWEWVTKKGWCGSGNSTPSANKVNATWYYTWSADQATTSTLEYVPIKHTLYWPGWSEISGKQYVTHVLGYNEPDHTEQANASVDQAIAEWPNMLKTGLRVGAPACTNFSWLYDFMDKCKAKNYRVDFVPVHAYWGGKTPANWYNDLKYIHDKTGRPLWITEWNNGANWTTESWPTDWNAQLQKQLSDIKAILLVLDTAHFVERYAIYNWVTDKRAMILGDTLTPAGKYYAANNSAMAFNRTNEVIPDWDFTLTAPTMTLTQIDKSNISLAWTDVYGEFTKEYIIEKKINDGVYAAVFHTTNLTTRTYSENMNATVIGNITYRIKYHLANSTYQYSNEQTSVVSSLAGAPELIKDEELSIYPNPTSEYLYFKLKLHENMQIKVFNMFGTLVKSMVVSNNALNVQDLAPGCYLLKASNYKMSKFIHL